MEAGDFLASVRGLASTYGASVPSRARQTLERLTERLEEPVRVAVVGRVNAGKSTAVNALLGQKVAPTDVSECTKVVTWFRFGSPQRVVLELRAGGSRELQLTAEGCLPEIDVPARDVAAIHAYLTNDTLSGMTLVDTPGLGSVNDDHSSATRSLLAAASGTTLERSVDAFIYLLSPVLMADEDEMLKLMASSGGSAANAVGVLGRADQIGDEDDGSPWEAARTLARSHAQRLGDELSAVVPVMTLLAETARTASITERDAYNLSKLAALGDEDLDRSLWSPDRFLAQSEPLSSEERRRLLGLLDLGGLAQVVRLVRSGMTGAGELCQALERESGIADVLGAVASFVDERRDLLKARSVLDALFEMTFRDDSGISPEVCAKLRADIEALRLDPALHRLADLEIWQACRNGEVTLPEALLDDLRRLVSGGPGAPESARGTPDEAAGARSEATGWSKPQLAERMRAWRAFMNSQATPEQARVVRVVLQSLQSEWSLL